MCLIPAKPLENKLCGHPIALMTALYGANLNGVVLETISELSRGLEPVQSAIPKEPTGQLDQSQEVLGMLVVTDQKPAALLDSPASVRSITQRRALRRLVCRLGRRSSPIGRMCPAERKGRHSGMAST